MTRIVMFEGAINSASANVESTGSTQTKTITNAVVSNYGDNTVDFTAWIHGGTADDTTIALQSTPIPPGKTVVLTKLHGQMLGNSQTLTIGASATGALTGRIVGTLIDTA